MKSLKDIYNFDPIISILGVNYKKIFFKWKMFLNTDKHFYCTVIYFS